MSGFPLTLWLTLGWVLLAAAVATLSAFLLRLLWYSLVEFVVEHFALAALVVRRSA